jgi:molybdopterin-guanine dinucleotide biosynthesis protein A
MPAGIVLVPEGVDRQSVADTVEAVAPGVETVTVVCGPDRRDEIERTTDARTVSERVPDGGLVAAMRAGFRATSALTAIVTTPEAPTVAPSALTDLDPPADADARLALIDGARHPPLGGYNVSPAVQACDVTLATGSRRLPDVLSRLSVATTAVSTPPAESTVRAKHET